MGLCESDPGKNEELLAQITIVRRKKPAHASGRWAAEYDACIDCGTTGRPHLAYGRCKRCDDRWRYRGKDL